MWDLRSASRAITIGPGQQQQASLSSLATPACVALYEGHKEAVGGFALHKGDVVSYAGASIGVMGLHDPASAAAVTCTKLTNKMGGKDAATIVGLALLPHSRLFAVGCEDGVIKLCR